MFLQSGTAVPSLQLPSLQIQRPVIKAENRRTHGHFLSGQREVSNGSDCVHGCSAGRPSSCSPSCCHAKPTLAVTPDSSNGTHVSLRWRNGCRPATSPVVSVSSAGRPVLGRRHSCRSFAPNRVNVV